MYQQILLVGNLGKDPDPRYLASGTMVTSFSMATNEKWTGQDGVAQERTMWFRVSVFGKAAEACNKYLMKGARVLVQGRLTGDPKTGGPKTWTGQDGATRASFEVTASVVKFLSPKNGENTGAGDPAEAEAVIETADIPF